MELDSNIVERAIRIHLGARAYDPVTGRFMQADPIGFSGGDRNLYSYSINDPVNRIDPSGVSSTLEQQRLMAANTAMAVGAVEAISGGVASLIERIFAAMQGALFPDVVYSGLGNSGAGSGAGSGAEVGATPPDPGQCGPGGPGGGPDWRDILRRTVGNVENILRAVSAGISIHTGVPGASRPDIGPTLRNTNPVRQTVPENPFERLARDERERAENIRRAQREHEERNRDVDQANERGRNRGNCD